MVGFVGGVCAVSFLSGKTLSIEQRPQVNAVVFQHGIEARLQLTYCFVLQLHAKHEGEHFQNLMYVRAARLVVTQVVSN
jgi:hypothetical protein